MPLPAISALVITICVSFAIQVAKPHQVGVHYHEEVVYQWNTIEYDWPNSTLKAQEISNGNYEPRNSAVNGIKIFNDKVYVTTPRLKTGVPVTLSVVIENPNQEVTSVSHVLRPFPSWDMQKVGDCNALQLVQSMEIDVNTGYMWIVDTGFVPKDRGVEIRPVDHCPSKIIIYDLDNDREIHRYNFPADVVGSGLYYLNDIVLGYENNETRYAFMSETLGYKLVVYDFKEDLSYSYSHPSMIASKAYENITIGSITITNVITGINGIAMSPDFKYIYYSAVAGVSLHQVETSVVTSAKGDNSKFAASVRSLGEKVSPGDGMAYGAKHNLYYSALGSNAVYKWNILNDLDGNRFKNVRLNSQSKLVSHDLMEWVDTLALDDKGYLWFTTSRLQKHFSEEGIDDQEPNFFVWKVFVDDYSYMNQTVVYGPVQGSVLFTASPMLIFIGCLLSWADISFA